MGRTQKARPDSLRIKAAGVLWLRRFCATVALITASKGTVKSYVQNSLQAAEKALLYGFVADADGEFRVMTLADVSHTMPLASLGCTAVNISMCVRRIRERFFVSTASIVSIFPRGKTGELCVGITPSGHFARLYQFLVREPNQHNPNPFPIGDGFGLLLFFDRYESAYFRNGVQRKPTSKPRGARKKKQVFAEQKVTDAVFTVCRLFAFLLVLCLLPHLFTTHFPFANSS